MIRIQVVDSTTENNNCDSTEIVREAIQSKIRLLRFALDKSVKAMMSFEEKYHFSSLELAQGKTVEDLNSHEDFQEWEGEVYIHTHIKAELEALENVIYEHC